jgi:gamma-glutamylputrescine oxidase
VVVLEAQHVGFGASGRNGGFVFGGYSLDCADLLLHLGPERAKSAYDLTRRAVNLIRERIRHHHIECEAVEGGALLANWFDDDDLLFEQRRLMAEHFDVQWRYVSREELPRWVRSARYTAGLLEPDAFHFHPLKYALGEAAAIEAGGGRIYEASPVTGIAPRGDGSEVATPSGSVRARHVVVAGGGYLAGLVPALERAILPIATYVMVTQPIGDVLEQLIPSRAAIYERPPALVGRTHLGARPQCRRDRAFPEAGHGACVSRATGHARRLRLGRDDELRAPQDAADRPSHPRPPWRALVWAGLWRPRGGPHDGRR